MTFLLIWKKLLPKFLLRPVLLKVKKQIKKLNTTPMKTFKIRSILSFALLIAIFGCNSDDATVNPDEEAMEQPKDSIPNPDPNPKPDSEGKKIIFDDDFSSGDLLHTNGDARWTSKKEITVVENAGNFAANFRYVGSSDLSADAFAELRFDLGAVYPELWLQYDLYIPAHYYHRDAESSDNNKMLRIWHTEYGDEEKVGFSAWQNGNGFSTATADWRKIGQGIGPKGDRVDDFISSDDLGKWMSLKVYAKAATANTPGTFKLWKNGELVMNNVDLLENYAADEKHGYRKGYLLGWSNSGFNEETHLLIDNVVFLENDSVD